MADSGKVTVRLPDGSRREVARGTTARTILAESDPAHANLHLAALLDGVPVDLSARSSATHRSRR